jgi:hypothetical protein
MEVDSPHSLRDYAAKLKSRVEVCLLYEIKLTSLYKLRVRHQVPLLPGGTFHIDDINAALTLQASHLQRSASPRCSAESPLAMPAPRSVGVPSANNRNCFWSRSVRAFGPSGTYAAHALSYSSPAPVDSTLAVAQDRGNGSVLDLLPPS